MDLVTYTGLALRGSNSGRVRWAQRSGFKRTHPGNTNMTLETLQMLSSGALGQTRSVMELNDYKPLIL